MRIAQIIPLTHVDGMGARASLYVQGCSIRCPSCQNPHMFDASGGEELTVGQVVSRLHATGQRKLTILGGEPTEQAWEVACVLRELANIGWDHFVVYTGRVYEDLLKEAKP